MATASSTGLVAAASWNFDCVVVFTALEPYPDAEPGIVVEGTTNALTVVDEMQREIIADWNVFMFDEVQVKFKSMLR